MQRLLTRLSPRGAASTCGSTLARAASSSSSSCGGKTGGACTAKSCGAAAAAAAGTTSAPSSSSPSASAASASTEPQCTNCGACINGCALICRSCACVQPAGQGSDFFALLGVPATFDVDPALLEAHYKARQKWVHPDLFSTASKAALASSSSLSTALNVAYATLKAPLTRAAYLLQRAGVDALGEGAGSAAVSPALLMEVMEAREVIEDASTSETELVALRDRAGRAVDAGVADLSAAFKRGDVGAAAAVTVALQYYSKIVAEAEEALEARRAASANAPRDLE